MADVSSKRIQLGISPTGPVTIDIPTLIGTRLLVTASSGGGKSETLRRILEEASEHVQCIVIDPEGEFSTLREKKPFVLIGEGGEAAADVRTAALVATRLLELNASAVCDLYEMRVQDRHEWVKRFLDSMVHAPKSLWHPVLIVIDEAHTFAPERGVGESVALQSVIDMANLGRKRGFCLIPATQRLSKLSKNVVEPMQNYLVGRTTFDDQARAASVFKIAPGAATRQFSLELEQLAAGQFIARGRAFNGDLLKVQVTRGATRPPATGTAMAGLVTPTPAAIRALLPKLADLPQEAEKEAVTVEELKAELAEARRKLAARGDIAETIALRGETVRLRAEVERMDRIIRFGQSKFDRARAILAESLDDHAGVEVSGPALIRIGQLKARIFNDAEEMTPPTPARPFLKPASGMSKACRLILTALAQHGACSKQRVAALTGYAVNGGGFNNALGECRSKGWMTGSDPLEATQEGIVALGGFDPLPRGKELLAMWQTRLSKAEREILTVLASKGKLTKDGLATATGYAAGGGGFNNALGHLRTLGLIVGSGILQLTDDFAKAVRG